MPLVTLAQAAAHLRLDIDDVDASPSTDERVPDLALKLTQAESIVIDYLKLDDAAYELAVDGDPDTSPPTAPTWSDRSKAVVSAAILLVLSALWDDEIERTLGDYLKNDGVIDRLLARLRKPALA